MVEPLSEVVTLLQPGAPFSKIVSGAGHWRVRRSEYGRPFYCVILDGSSRLAVDGHEPVALRAGDFILVPAAYGFTMSSLEPATSEDTDIPPVTLPDGQCRVGTQGCPPDVRLLIGYCVFGSPDAALLVSLLPQLVYVRGETRLATLVELVVEESRQLRPARDIILARLLEVVLIEALRSTAGTAASPGLLRGLADARLAVAIRRMHESPTRPWTVAQLAKEAALSRSAFFERFRRAVGVSPMEYLLAWRMALAKNLLRRKEGGVAEVAERVGYSSASTFSVAFSRHVGLPPMQYAREQTGNRDAVARAPDLTISPTLLARADEVFE
ncbi:AraC family transcriptional regulator [Bradyrhizobium genosp. P]|uniref:AraC family transcriptional regulator n=1 Tax=Bradyrhizobium genosp. P TaxID=83641 RepID=UPI003CF8D2B2